ncbi:MAG: hypothetical protein DRJ10_17190, partial [Bacteroidetes bacterium]
MNKRCKHIYLLLIFSLLLSVTSFGQHINPIISTSLNNSSWVNFKKKTEALGITYYLQTDSTPNISMIVDSDSLLLMDVLKNSFKPWRLKIATDGYGSVFMTKGVSIKTQLPLGFFKQQYTATTNDNQSTKQEKNEGQLA